MRVLFISGEYPTMQGGVGDYTRRLAQALGDLGADVRVLTAPDAGPDTLRVPAAPHEPEVVPALRRGWGLWGQVAGAVDEYRPDAVHIQYQTAAYGLHPAINLLPGWLKLARRDDPPVYTTFHDLRVPYIMPKAGPLRWQAVLALARGSRAAVVTNPADWVQLAAAGLARRLAAIPIGSNIRPTPPAGYDRAAQRRRWGLGPDDWLLAYFGFLNATKGGETLVRSLAQLAGQGRPAHLLMIGGQVGASDPTNQAYLAHVRKLIDDLGLADRVQWTGFTDDAEVTANLLAADCAVLPYDEGASLRHGSLMAALAHALPIVTTVISSHPAQAAPAQAQSARTASTWRVDVQGLFPRLNDGNSALLVPPGNPELTAEAVCRVMGDAALRSRLSAGAAGLAAQFDWETIARQHLDLYHRR